MPVCLLADVAFVFDGVKMWNMDVELILGLVLLSGLTALIGLEMANNPPTKPWHRWAYRATFGALFLLTLLVAFVQATRNLNEQARIQKAASEQQGIQSAQYSAVKAKLDLIESLAKQAGTSPTQIAAAIQTISHLNLPSGELSNSELRERAFDLVKKIRALVNEYAKKQQELVDYWKEGVAETPERHRIKDFDDLTMNERFEFESGMLGEYVYLCQEIVNRLPENKLPVEMPRRNAGAALWASGMFTAQRSLPLAADRLSDLASRLK